MTAIDIELMDLEMRKGREGGYLWGRNRSVKQLKKEIEEVTKILDDMVKELGDDIYNNIDYFYLLGWREGVCKALREKERGK